MEGKIQWKEVVLWLESLGVAQEKVISRMKPRTCKSDAVGGGKATHSMKYAVDVGGKDNGCRRYDLGRIRIT